MKIKIDENLPRLLCEDLAALGFDAHTVPQEGLTGSFDDHVWKVVQHEKRFFITQDLDFSDVRKFTPGKHCGILLVRLREPGREALRKRVLEVFRNENVSSWKDCFVVMTDKKIRVQRPV